MSKLPLTFACGPYDRMEALNYGLIDVEGIDLNFLEIQAPREIFDRMVGAQEFDLSEMSLAEYVTMTAKEISPFIAIPVFPSKAFRHAFVCVNKAAAIKEPKDLAGKRIGTPLYTQTAAIWIRGDLENIYGVDLSGVQWIQGAMEKPGSHGTRPRRRSFLNRWRSYPTRPTSRCRRCWPKAISMLCWDHGCPIPCAPIQTVSATCFRISGRRKSVTTRNTASIRSCTRW